MPNLDRQEALSRAGDQLGQWLDKAGDQMPAVPTETWQGIARFALEVTAHAQALADEGERV